jgi:cation:H+ antiporter
MLLHIVTIVVGFAALAWSADRFVLGAAGAARDLGLSPLVIGLTIVAFGTSAPEMLVSAMAAWQGNPGLAIGNAVGSNIANMGLILGLTALVTPLAVGSAILRREVPILFAVMGFALLLLWDGMLGRTEGGLLMLALFALVGFLLWQSKRKEAADDPMSREFAAEIPSDMPLGRALLWFGIGLLGLLVSSRVLVWASVELATAFGVSDLIIGLSIVALGTSLPELAASLAAVRHGEHDIAIGNLIGSNMFNLLGVVGLAGLISPTPVDPAVIWRDFGAMIVITAGALAMSRGAGRPRHVDRWEGALLVAAYLGYQWYLFAS